MYISEIKQNWKIEFSARSFKWQSITGLIIAVVILSCLPFFFQYIEKREGFTINDTFLQNLPVKNMSVPIFITIWCIGLITAFRVFTDPTIFINFLWSFIFLTLFRMATITLTPLNPPDKIIPLIDPLTNMVYGKSFVSKDLFFSGHTAYMFVIFFCLRNKVEKILALAATFIVGALVLVQHVHYTIDVAIAPLFAFLAFYAATKITKRPPGSPANQLK